MELIPSRRIRGWEELPRSRGAGGSDNGLVLVNVLSYTQERFSSWDVLREWLWRCSMEVEPGREAAAGLQSQALPQDVDVKPLRQHIPTQNSLFPSKKPLP